MACVTEHLSQWQTRHECVCGLSWKSHMAASHCGHIDTKGMVQVVMTQDQLVVFERWLETRQRNLYPVPYDKDDDLPTFGIGFIDRTQASRGSHASNV